jgi:RecB family exonuclease
VAAARRLAALATADVGAEPLAPQADPAHWWGTRRRSRSEQPLRDPDEPLVLSASALEALLACPAHWFLRREAGGQEAATSSQGFGKIVHAVADRVAKGEVAELEPLMALVDEVWGQMVFRTPWAGSRERAEIEKALARFLAWHQRPGARTVIGTETELHAEVTVAGETVRLFGFADRLELDEDGRVVVVDLKTGKYFPTTEQVGEHAQLGLYQHAVAHGAADHLVEGGGRLTVGGAELVHLRHDTRGQVKVQTQPPPEPGEDGLTLVEAQLEEAVQRLRSEDLPAIAGPHCKHCGFLPICPIKGAGTVLST